MTNQQQDRFRWFFIGPAVALAAACGADDLVLPDQTEPTRIEVVSGTNQAGSIGTMLAEPLVVRVTDSRARPVSGREVAFRVVSGLGGAVLPDTARTDADGRASVRWVLGESEGTQQVRAQVVGGIDLTASFTATAGAGVAASVEQVRGNGQTATAGSTLADSLVVRTRDAQGAPVGGITVVWTAVGGGSVSAPSTVTGPDGTTGVRRTLGPTAGAQQTVATVEGAAGSPVTFTSTAAVGEAGRLVIQIEPASSSPSGVAFSRQPQVQLVDANGNPVARTGLAVSAEIASGPAGATLVGSTTVSTNDQGLAVFGNLGISGASATYTLNFTAANVAGAISQPISISAGAAAALAMVTQPSASTPTGSPFAQQPAVRLVDAIGNPVARAGVTVTVGLASGSGSLSGTTSVPTDGSGVARFSDLAISGSGDHTLIFAASGLATVVSATVNVIGAPSASTSTIAAPATLPAGVSGVAVVTVRTASGVPLGGKTVTLQMSGTGNSISPASGITNGAGEAAFTISSTKAESKSLTATVDGVTIGPVTVSVQAGPAHASETTADVPDGRRFRETVITVQAYDEFGNIVRTGGAVVSGEVIGGPNEGIQLVVDDREDGTYLLSYIPLFSDDDDDTDRIEILLGGAPIKGSPFSSKIRR
ncbi:MAG TPA: Ig-like domain-containing protein [Gemmatimonadales bacterium]|nr:Ig-like domain-containing protein [Gemmatimonadales bacterium]